MAACASICAPPSTARAWPWQIDVGFGDAVTPDAQPVTYPTLLPDVPAPRLHAYPKQRSSPKSRTP